MGESRPPELWFCSSEGGPSTPFLTISRETLTLRDLWPRGAVGWVRRGKAGCLEHVARGASSSFVLGSNRRHKTDPSPVQDQLCPGEFFSPFHTLPARAGPRRTPAPPLPPLSPAHGPPGAPRLLRPSPRAPGRRSAGPLGADAQHCPAGS